MPEVLVNINSGNGCERSQLDLSMEMITDNPSFKIYKIPLKGYEQCLAVASNKFNEVLWRRAITPAQLYCLWPSTMGIIILMMSASLVSAGDMTSFLD